MEPLSNGHEITAGRHRSSMMTIGLSVPVRYNRGDPARGWWTQGWAPCPVFSQALSMTTGQLVGAPTCRDESFDQAFLLVTQGEATTSTPSGYSHADVCVTPPSNRFL